MIKILAVCCIFLATTGAVKKCTIDPDELKWSRAKICDTEMAYPHETIEQALRNDREMLEFVENAASFYNPALPYSNIETCNAYLGTPQEHVLKNVECGSICPGRIVNLTTVWYEWEKGQTTMCNVIRPWEQIVYYTECNNKFPIVDRMSDSFRCLPESHVNRKIAVYCPDIAPQCRKMDIELPQHCAASQLKCIKKETKFSVINDIFAGFSF